MRWLHLFEDKRITSRNHHDTASWHWMCNMTRQMQQLDVFKSDHDAYHVDERDSGQYAASQTVRPYFD